MDTYPVPVANKYMTPKWEEENKNKQKTTRGIAK